MMLIGCLALFVVLFFRILVSFYPSFWIGEIRHKNGLISFKVNLILLYPSLMKLVLYISSFRQVKFVHCFHSHVKNEAQTHVEI